jgi:hypothetical protein
VSHDIMLDAGCPCLKAVMFWSAVRDILCSFEGSEALSLSPIGQNYKAAYCNIFTYFCFMINFLLIIITNVINLNL